ncbi:T9SS type A sorting domain-containing protein [Fulvivirga sp. 29W222]|uniref:T9SS type A sorting domain-containing protein n=1 Tax=Fulvivirga marina TaxID=2494733 RepID=A0A937FU10_9BACT|nr:T9SS type A sorting domain-containing protein [Fulvivirga marina]MBL6444913.1 T9SS type A sorting domain-containing protein [Fulvivirga marina]
MKIFLSMIFSFAIICFAHAQNFEVIEQSGTLKGSIGGTVKAPIKIKNTSDRPIQIIVKRTDQIIGTSQSSYFCWGDECYEPEISQMPLSKKLEPGETSSKLKTVLETGLSAGFSTVKYLIYDRDNPSDAVEYEVTYTVEDLDKKNTIFSSDQVHINDVYPNPVVDFAIIDYNLLKEDIHAKIVIHNVLGSIIGEYELAYLETKLKINTEELNPGVYFYTLYIDNDGIMTRKLVIRK